MVNLLDAELSKAISEEDGPLYTNVLAHNVYALLKDNSLENEDDADRHLSYNLLSRQRPATPPSETRESSRSIDHRFRNVILSGVKNFPYNTDFRYGLDFSIDHNPCSTVILGRNGIGKTSVYAALEYAGMNRMFTAHLRNVEADDFIRNKDTTLQNVSIELTDASANHIKHLHPQESPLTVPAHFCSEKDVFDIEQDDQLTDFVFAQLGIESFLTLTKKLKSVKETWEHEFETFQMNNEEINNLYFEKLLPTAILLSQKDSILAASRQILFLVPSLIGTPINEDANIALSNLRQVLNSLHTNTTLLDKEIEDNLKYVIDITPPAYKSLRRRLNSVCDMLSEYIADDIDCPTLGNELTAINDQLTRLSDLRTKTANAISLYRNEIDREDALRQFQSAIHKLQHFESGINTDIYQEKEDTLSLSLQELNQLICFLDNKLSSLIEEVIYPKLEKIFIPMVNSILDDDKLIIKIIKTSDNISVKLDRANNDEGTAPIASFSPREYLNTFRYKLFAFTLKFALSCTAKVLYSENWPFVIDDIFDSSDFHNRVYLHDFISDLVKSYKDIEGMADFPLQIIFFSQDEIIGDTVFKGFRLAGIPGKLCRLHAHKHIPADTIKDGVMPLSSDIDKCNIAKS